MEIPLSQGKFAIVDKEDYNFLMQWKWCVHSYGYAVRNVHITLENGKKTCKMIAMHRVIMNAPDNMDVDHINRDVRDNRRINLRICTTRENLRNKISKRGFSKYKGVGWHKCRKRWRAYIVINDKHKSLGHFSTEEDAAIAYNNAALKYFGEFAKLNIIRTAHAH